MQRLFDDLNEENFLIFAAKSYNNPACVDVDEFYDDLARFKYIKRLLRKYVSSGILQERLILNHIIILFNVFGVQAALKMILYKMDEEHLSAVKTFLLYLNLIKDTDLINTPIDTYVANSLRKI